MILTLDLVQTVAFAGIVLFLGYGVRGLIPFLARVNIPAPVCGGLLVAALLAVLHGYGIQPFKFDSTLQIPLQNAFFASIGFGASVALLWRGGMLVVFFLVIATVVAFLQNVVGGAIALALGQHPLMGVIAGSVTLTGGPATGLAFAPFFQEAGVSGAATLAVAAAMVGIVAGGVIGGPIGTLLIERKKIGRQAGPPAPGSTLENLAERQFVEPVIEIPPGEDVESYVLAKHLVIVLLSVALGLWLSAWMTPVLAQWELNLPVYIGAMIVAAVIRNADDWLHLFGLSQRVIDDIGTVALSLFLAMALMTLRLWEIAGLVVPLLIILAVQVVMIAGHSPSRSSRDSWAATTMRR